MEQRLASYCKNSAQGIQLHFLEKFVLNEPDEAVHFIDTPSNAYDYPQGALACGHFGEVQKASTTHCGCGAPSLCSIGLIVPDGGRDVGKFAIGYERLGTEPAVARKILDCALSDLQS